MKRMRWFTTVLGFFVGTSVVAVAVWTLAGSDEFPKSSATDSGQPQQLSRSEKHTDEVRPSEGSSYSAVGPSTPTEVKKGKRDPAGMRVRRSPHSELDLQLD
jgi:hypothetical protein